MDEVQSVLEQLHETDGIPRLEIEGCSYPRNEELTSRYEDTGIEIPESSGYMGAGIGIITVEFSEAEDEEERLRRRDYWLKNDGRGGQIGSVNVEPKYLRHLDKYLGTEEGERCAYVLQDVFDRRHELETQIEREYILFRRSDLEAVVLEALESEDGVGEDIIPGVRVFDGTLWEDSIPSGPFEVEEKQVKLDVHVDEGEARYRIETKG